LTVRGPARAAVRATVLLARPGDVAEGPLSRGMQPSDHRAVFGAANQSDLCRRRRNCPKDPSRGRLSGPSFGTALWRKQGRVRPSTRGSGLPGVVAVFEWVWHRPFEVGSSFQSRDSGLAQMLGNLSCALPALKGPSSGSQTSLVALGPGRVAGGPPTDGGRQILTGPVHGMALWARRKGPCPGLEMASGMRGRLRQAGSATARGNGGFWGPRIEALLRGPGLKRARL